MAKKPKTIAFEEAFKRLEDIVQKLESGSLPLDQSLKLFEEGVSLTKVCRDQLAAAEKSLQTLVKNTEGRFTLEEPE